MEESDCGHIHGPNDRQFQFHLHCDLPCVCHLTHYRLRDDE